MAPKYLLTSEDYYRNFKDSIRSNDTFLSYDAKLKAFMKSKGLAPSQGQYSQLIEGKDTRDIESDIASFISSLRERHYTLGSQKSYLNALIHFYSMNDVPIRRKWISKFMSNDDNNNEDDNGNGEKPYTRDQIARLLEYSDIRSRAMILLMCSSGMRVGGLSSVTDSERTKTKYLRVGDLTPVEEHKIYQITVYSYSKSDKHWTFCTPECRKAIDNYLDYRRQCGENITPKSPLLRQEFDKEDIFAVANAVKPITRFAMKKALTKVMYASGIRTPIVDNKNRLTARRETALTHGFRKYFDTTCTNAGMNKLYIEFCMGHTLPGVKGSYFKPQPDSNGIYRDLLEGHEKSSGYLDSIDWLTIDDSKRLKRENEMLKVNKSEIEQLKEKAKEYDSFMAQYNPMFEEFQREINNLKLSINSEVSNKKKDNKKKQTVENVTTHGA